MQAIDKLLIVGLFFFSALSHSEPVPLEHRAHCEKWENNKCVSGKLTELANSLNNGSFQNNARSETCDKVCREGCPNCSKCGFCTFCGWYEDAACHNVPYFKDRETCSTDTTKSCCDLCEVQCKSSQGVCSSQGFCRGGGVETDLLSYCIERTTGETCAPCGRN